MLISPSVGNIMRSLVKPVIVKIMRIISGYSVSHSIFFVKVPVKNFSQFLIMRTGKLPEQISSFYFLNIVNFHFELITRKLIIVFIAFPCFVIMVLLALPLICHDLLFSFLFNSTFKKSF